MTVDAAQVDTREFPFHGTCDQCAEGDKPLRSISATTNDCAWICADCIAFQERAIKAALDAAHGFDVDGASDGFHRTCALSKAVERAVLAYCEFADD